MWFHHPGITTSIKQRASELSWSKKVPVETPLHGFTFDDANGRPRRMPFQILSWHLSNATIDTASLAGTIVNSFTNEPVEGALIMLYSSFADSLPYIKRPTHMAKSGKNGRFKVNNLKNIDYKLVAITDANGNYLYNQGIEDIAFVEDKVTHDMLMNASDSSRWVRLRT